MESIPFFAIILCVVDFVNVEAIQTSATISPREYTASLDANASTIFQCDVTGANSILWVVDGLFAIRQEVRQRGISTSYQITVNQTEGRFTSNISIPRSEVNKNTTILCIACVLFGQDVLSSPAFFKIQGLLGSPPNLTMNGVRTLLDEFVKVLTWDEPNTLDITNIEPDISHYRVCYNISTTMSCVNTTNREFTFLNVRVNVLFSVTTVNVVGEGNASTIMHWACDRNRNTAPINVPGNEVISIPTLYGESNKEVDVNFTFFQTFAIGGDPNCFDVYEVWTIANSDAKIINHGRQFPKVMVDDTSNTRWLTLSVNSISGLRENEHYSAIIYTVNNNGRAKSAGSIDFSTYDIQSVSMVALNKLEVLEFNCTFIRGSQAQSCTLTVCHDPQDLSNAVFEEQCMNVTIRRDQNHRLSTKRVIGFKPGVYTISGVVEIERDGSETVLRSVPEFVYAQPPTMTTYTTNSISLNNMTFWPKPVIIIVGCVTGIAFISVVSLLMILILILWYRQHFKTVEPEPQEVVYDEPYPLASRPKTELQMEACPAYGIVLSAGTVPGTHALY